MGKDLKVFEGGRKVEFLLDNKKCVVEQDMNKIRGVFNLTPALHLHGLCLS